MAAIEKRTKRYPTDLTDEEWAVVGPLLPEPAKRGRKRATDLRRNGLQRANTVRITSMV